MNNIGVFTTIKVTQGIPLFFDRHQTRLSSHAKQLGIPIRDFSLATINTYVRNNNLTDCALKIILDDKLSIKHRSLPHAKKIKAITVEDNRDELKTLKTTNRIANDQAKARAEKYGADDALFILNAFIIESTSANIFSTDENGNVITPALDDKGLKGIARQVIMERMPVKEIPLPKDTNRPLVLVNSLRVQPIAKLDERILPDAKYLVQRLREVLEK